MTSALAGTVSEGPSVSVASGDTFDVRQFSVHERMSSLFVVSLLAHCHNPSVDFHAVVGHPARFSVRSAGQEREWTGLVSRLQQIAVEEGGTSTYQIELVPTLWLLTQRRNHRMFQQQSELDIVLALLAEWGIEPVKKLGSTYKKRKYRVQYAETDFAFLSRMLEDAGISFYFERQDDETRLVLADAPQDNAPRAAAIPFRDNPTSAALQHVKGVRIGQEVRPGKVTVRDHDYRLPPDYKLLASASGGGGIEQRLEQFHYAPGAFLFGTDKGEATPAADDRGRSRTDEPEGQTLAQKRLEATRAGALRCTFETNALDLAPGVVMSMLDHPHAELGAGKSQLVTESSLSGSPHSLSHSCETRSAAAPFRPERVTPRPRVSGVESATVVGPKGEEIHTDEFGRVRVHFHWDRESAMDEKSSCWIHVSQAWGGAGYGGSNLPRIGQEVLVDFLGGDPDRPVITGRLYTNLQKTPYKLPDNKTQSGWKSNSTGGSGGYNELMFEDALGKELLRMQAEKDLTKLVKNDEQSTVGRNRTRRVKGNEDVTIQKNRTARVAKNEQLSVGLNQSISVGVNRSAQIGAIDSVMVGDTHVVMVSPPGEGGGGPSTSTVMKDKKIILDTGDGATITMDGPTITIAAKVINVNGVDEVNINGTRVKIAGKSQADLTSSGPTTVSGVPVQLNGPGLFAGRVTELAPATITTGAALVLVGGASFPYPVVKQKDGSLKVGDHIIIKPGEGRYPDFQNKVLRDLGIMSSTPAGAERLAAIEGNKGGHDLTIREFSADEAKNYGENNSLCYPDAGDSGLHYDKDGNPVPGKGVGSTLAYNPDIQLGPNGHPEPADAVLFHEMGHADHNANGVNRGGEKMGDGWDNREEWQNIQGGVNQPGGTQVPGSPHSPSENDYLGDRDYPYRRTDHGWGYVNADGTPITP
jgi:type VI secretion system secreted protein VgrG